MKKILIAAAVALCAVLLVKYGLNEETEQYGSVLKRGLPTEVESLDIHKARSTQAVEVLSDLGEGLLTLSASAELLPGVATDWSISEDGLTYTFNLRAEAKWSNGDPVLASEFVYAMERLVDPAIGATYAQFLSDVSAVEAPDESTVVIRLERPTPYLLSLLTHPATFPMHVASKNQHGDSFARPGNLITNGAYKLVDWVPGSMITMARNEHYWNSAAVAIDEVQYHIIVQDSVEYARYRAGELHVTSTVPSESFEQAREEFGDQLRVASRLALYYYGFNLSKPPFKDNPKLRQALSMAIDRDQIVENVTRRGELPAYSWVPIGMPNYATPGLSYASLTQEERNQVARRLYKEAGYSDENPLSIEIRYNTQDAHQRVAETIQSMWAEVLGVQATLVNEEWQVFLQNMRDAEVTQVFRSSWTGDYPDAHTFLSILQSDNSMNMPRYVGEGYDEYMRRAAEQVDPVRRRGYLEEAERLMLADHPAMPIYFYNSRHLVHPEIEGWQDNILDYHYSQYLRFKAAD